MKRFLAAAASSVVVLLLVACSGADTEAACKKVSSLCNASGGGVTVTVTCDPDKLDEASNASDVTDCIDTAKDCNGAMACMLKAKK